MTQARLLWLVAKELSEYLSIPQYNLKPALCHTKGAIFALQGHEVHDNIMSTNNYNTLTINYPQVVILFGEFCNIKKFISL